MSTCILGLLMHMVPYLWTIALATPWEILNKSTMIFMNFTDIQLKIKLLLLLFLEKREGISSLLIQLI